MTRTARRARAAAALAITTILATSTGCAPAPAPSAAPAGPDRSVTSARTTFVSTLYGYSLTYPADWSVAAGSRPWRSPADALARGSADVFTSPTGRAILVASQRIPKGTTASSWVDHYLSRLDGAGEPTCRLRRADWSPVRIDGRLGGMVGGDFGCGRTTVVVVAGGRGYVFDARPDLQRYTDAVFDQAVLDELVHSVRLSSPGTR